MRGGGNSVALWFGRARPWGAEATRHARVSEWWTTSHGKSSPCRAKRVRYASRSRSRPVTPVGSGRMHMGLQPRIRANTNTSESPMTMTWAGLHIRPFVMSGAILPHSSGPGAHIHTPPSPVTPQAAKNAQARRPGRRCEKTFPSGEGLGNPGWGRGSRCRVRRALWLRSGVAWPHPLIHRRSRPIPPEPGRHTLAGTGRLRARSSLGPPGTHQGASRASAVSPRHRRDRPEGADG